jgi:hypothetical protein
LFPINLNSKLCIEDGYNNNRSNNRKIYISNNRQHVIPYGGQLYRRNFNIGGNLTDCVKVSILYNQNQPVAAVIPHIVSDDAQC